MVVNVALDLFSGRFDLLVTRNGSGKRRWSKLREWMQ